MDNSSPAINKTKIKREVIATEKGFVKNVTKATVFEVLRDITDPEHPYTLEELSVISLKNIEIFKKEKNQDSICTKGLPINTVRIIFTPTVPHCSLVGIIALCIFYQLYANISGFSYEVQIENDAHSQAEMYNKQFTDEERILAAFENESIMEIIKNCTENTFSCEKDFKNKV